MLTLVENRASVLPFCLGTIKNRDQRGHWSRFHRPGRRGPLVPVLFGPLVPVRGWNRDQRVSTCGCGSGTPGREPLVPVCGWNRDQRSSLHISSSTRAPAPFWARVHHSFLLHFLSLTQVNPHFFCTTCEDWRHPIYSRVSDIILSSEVATLAHFIASLAHFIFVVLARCLMKFLS